MAVKKIDRYKDSPTLKRDDSDGKMKPTKKPTAAEKATSEDAAGTGGMAVHEVHQKQEKERFDLFQKQQKEFMEMHSRHMVEAGSDTDKAQGDE